MSPQNKHSLALGLFLLATLLLASCASESPLLTITPEINQAATSRIETLTAAFTPSPTSTVSFISATPPSIQRLPFRIAYIVQRASDGPGSIIGLLDQEYNQSILVENCIFCDSLAWSPDGKWIAFNAAFTIGADVQIYTVNVQNGEIKQVTYDSHPKSGVSWSPSGELLIYVEEGDPSNLVIRRMDGTYIKRIRSTPGYELSPVWSPDGTKIAFLYRAERSTEHTELWIMDQDGSNPYRVTDVPISFSTLSWSPDGEKILFLSNSSCNKLYSVQIDGSELREFLDYSGCIENPSWSPDGQFLIFVGETPKSDWPYSGWELFMAFGDMTNIPPLRIDIGGRPLIAVWDSSTK